jgi:hypothetical protein
MAATSSDQYQSNLFASSEIGNVTTYKTGTCASCGLYTACYTVEVLKPGGWKIPVDPGLYKIQPSYDGLYVVVRTKKNKRTAI